MSAELPPTADLRASLRDLDSTAEEAAEEGFPQPSHLALTNARRLLRDLYRLRPCRLEVYPTPDGEIAMVSPGGRRRSVLVLCCSDGGVLCSVNLNGRHRRARYSSATTLPDGFIREALGELDGRTFYGWATVDAEVARCNGRRAEATPTPGNLHHGDIVLPDDAAADREEQTRHAQELADASRWRPR